MDLRRNRHRRFPAQKRGGTQTLVLRHPVLCAMIPSGVVFVFLGLLACLAEEESIIDALSIMLFFSGVTLGISLPLVLQRNKKTRVLELVSAIDKVGSTAKELEETSDVWTFRYSYDCFIEASEIILREENQKYLAESNMQEVIDDLDDKIGLIFHLMVSRAFQPFREEISLSFMPDEEKLEWLDDMRFQFELYGGEYSWWDMRVVDRIYNECVEEVHSPYSFSRIDTMEGHDFERLCAKLFLDNGYINVEVTQGSGDYGVDVLAEKDGVGYAVQCKCYSSPVGISSVQQVYAGRDYYKRNVAAVITNQTFTKAAVEAAAGLGVVLWDRTALADMIRRVQSRA